MSKLEIVPFGKYKGQPVDALAQDRQYCEWLLQQDWFRTKFTAIHTLIINNFGERGGPRRPRGGAETGRAAALLTRKSTWTLLRPEPRDATLRVSGLFKTM